MGESPLIKSLCVLNVAGDLRSPGAPRIFADKQRVWPDEIVHGHPCSLGHTPTSDYHPNRCPPDCEGEYGLSPSRQLSRQTDSVGKILICENFEFVLFFLSKTLGLPILFEKLTAGADRPTR